MPYRAAQIALLKWRQVERQLSETEVGTPDSEWLQAEAFRLRNEYHRLLEAMRDSGDVSGHSASIDDLGPRKADRHD
jgi:hypothetical protein